MIRSCIGPGQILTFIYHKEVKICRGPMQLRITHGRRAIERYKREQESWDWPVSLV